MTCKEYVDNHIIWVVDEPTLFRNNKENDFNGYKLTNISSVTVNHDAVEDNDLVTLTYVKSLHEDNERSRRDLGLQFYDENDNLVKNNVTNDFNDNKILNIQSIELNNECTNNNHAANKEYVDKIITNESVITITRNSDMKGFNLINVNFLQVNYEPQISFHVVTRSYFDRMVDDNTIFRLNDDSNERYLHARVGNTALKFTNV